MTPEILQAMSSNPEAAREMLQSALAERAASDPRLAAILQMLAQQAPAAAPEPQVDRKQRLRERVQEMRDELSILRERNDVLAAALGACAICWGDDQDCDECRGDGTPGWEPPDPATYRELVAPAVERRAERTPSDKPTR